jgi:hypothetical protein
MELAINLKFLIPLGPGLHDLTGKHLLWGICNKSARVFAIRMRGSSKLTECINLVCLSNHRVAGLHIAFRHSGEAMVLSSQKRSWNPRNQRSFDFDAG